MKTNCAQLTVGRRGLPCAGSVVVMAVALGLLLASPAHAQYSVIYSFTGGVDGESPVGGPAFDEAGNLYGTANGGDNGSAGTVYKLAPNGSNWVFTVLYEFQGGQDGGLLTSGVVRDSQGILYGTAKAGGAYNLGTVFKLAPPANAPGGGTWTETTLYSFTGGSDGGYPTMYGGHLRFDNASNLYGTAMSGGPCPPPISLCGTAYKLSPSNGGWTFSVLHSFTDNGQDGYWPIGDVILDAAGNVYSTTYAGGSNDAGTIFQLTPSGIGYIETILENFCGPYSCLDGVLPQGGPVQDASGNIFATSQDAAVELVYPSYYLYPVINNGHLCCSPFGDLLVDASDNLYGTVNVGGAYGQGAVFKLTREINGGYYVWVYTSLHDFTGGTDGGQPIGSLAVDGNGNLYGTTTMGGAGNCPQGCGVVYKIVL